MFKSFLVLAVLLSGFVTSSSFAQDTGEATQEEIGLCFNDCLAAYDRPSAELKACVASCLNKYRKPLFSEFSKEVNLTEMCETYETGCDDIP